jgi:hypothetical protein
MIDTLLNQFVCSPNDPETNFALARYYHNIGQTASAVSYYIRTAERTDNLLLRYECLLHGANCFEMQGTRRFTVKGMLQQAISILPKRPEAYFLLSKMQEHNEANQGRYLDSYTLCSIAITVCEFDGDSLRNSVNYHGKYELLFQKGIMGWWNGLNEETKTIFLDLHMNYDMPEEYKTSVRNNLINMGAFNTKSLINYEITKLPNLLIEFDGADNVKRNYSEAYQDMFVLTATNGKRNGTYVEIGSGHPSYGNNTYLLEKEFGWRGLSLDIDENFIAQHSNERSHTAILKDATTINYDKYFTGMNLPSNIDYLQIDVDPADISLKVLYSMPFDTFKFSVITFEHDHYAQPHTNVREKARAFLKSYGYVLVASNISPDDFRPYEDWFVHPDLVDADIIKKLTVKGDDTKKAEKYMFGMYSG